jgi:hypothetical protein
MEYIEGLDQHTRYMVKNMMNSIFELGNNYIEYVRDFNSERGFMFSGGEKMQNIMNTRRVVNDGHSGCSASSTLRNCQYILENYPINDIETGLYYSSDDESETTSIEIIVYDDIESQSPPETPRQQEGKGTAFGSYIYNNMDNYNKTALDLWVSN